MFKFDLYFFLQISIVQVHSPPTIAMAQTGFKIVQGGSLVLECKSFGEPQPRIEWFLNDKRIIDAVVDEEGSLILDAIDREHQGIFKCVAENELGRAERLVNVTVHTAPVIEGAGLVKTSLKPKQ